MTEYRAWGVDWSLKTGVAIAWRDGGMIKTLRLGCVGQCQPQKLSGLYDATQLAAIHVGVAPTAVYYEQAFGQRMMWMHEAQGVVQAALWDALVRLTEFPPNVWPLKTTEWRQTLGMASPRGGTDKERRAARKQQQRVYAIGLGAAQGLSEDEYDAVCVMRAGELDLGAGKVVA